MENNKKSYYLLILVAGFLSFGIPLSMMSLRGSMFIAPVTQDLGFSLGAFSTIATVGSFLSILAAPLFSIIMGSNFDKKLLLIIGTIAHCIAIVLNASVSSIWAFHILNIITTLSLSAINNVLPVMIANWFVYKRATVMGIMYAGSSFFGALLTPILAFIIAGYGWESGYQFLGLICVVPLPFLLFASMSPSAKNMQAFSAPQKAEENAHNANIEQSTSIPYKKALKSAPFLLFLITITLCAMVTYGCMMHTVPYLLSIGYTAEFAAIILTAYMIFSIIGKILVGIIFDKFSLATSGIITTSFGVLAVVFLLFAPANELSVWAYGICLGLFSASVTIPATIVLPHIFGLKTFAQLMPLSTVGIGVGIGISVPLSGYLFDFMGHYSLAWYIYLSLAIVTVFAYPLIIKLGERIADQRVAD